MAGTVPAKAGGKVSTAVSSGVQSGWCTECKLQSVGGQQEPEQEEYIHHV